jgi:hypothetical protein
MRPGERITAIKETATLLSQQEWVDIDLTLREYGFPTSDSWHGTKYDYVMSMLDGGPTEKLQEVHEFVTGESADTAGAQLWREGHFRLFMSHLATHQEEVGFVGYNLRHYGVSCFVAHNSITPSAEWQTVIEAALSTCDAMAVFLHKDIKESGWCDQEVGFALARRIPVLPLSIDIIPYGFMAKLQAANCRPDDKAPVIAERILKWLLKTPSAQTAMTEGLVTALERSGSYDQTRKIFSHLEDTPVFNPRQLQRLEAAATENDQVSAAIGRGSRPIPELIKNLVSERRGSPESAYGSWDQDPPF